MQLGITGFLFSFLLVSPSSTFNPGCNQDRTGKKRKRKKKRKNRTPSHPLLNYFHAFQDSYWTGECSYTPPVVISPHTQVPVVSGSLVTYWFKLLFGCATTNIQDG
jgi:hypothetical protein